MRLTTWLSRARRISNSYKYSNLPESYIKRCLKQVYWAAPKDMPQYLPVEVGPRKINYTLDRPWTQEFQAENRPGVRRRKVFVEPIKEWSFFRGDKVQVLVGKDKGKIGVVDYIVEELNWIIVKGLNVKYERIGAMGDYAGMLIQKEAPLLVTTEVALVDPLDGEGTTIEWRYNEAGEKLRVSTRTGHVIPIPELASETIDYKIRSGYPEQPKDTTSKDVAEITYKPHLKTFEMDLMDHFGVPY